MMDDTVLSLKTQLLERDREIVALKKKLVQLEKVCSLCANTVDYLCKQQMCLCMFL